MGQCRAGLGSGSPSGKEWGRGELKQGLRQGQETEPHPAASPPTVDRGQEREDKKTMELEGPKPGLCHSDDRAFACDPR